MDRRNFIKTLGAVSIAALAPTFSVSARDSNEKLKIVVFFDEDFPGVDGLKLNRNILREALDDHDAVFTKGIDLKLSNDVDLFINAHGSAFPKSAWKTILKYLQDGGNFLNLGGVPFAVPVGGGAKGWREETRQVNFHKRLGILQSFVIENNPKSFQTNIEQLKSFSAAANVEKAFALYPRLTTRIEFPEEAGGDGAREGKMSALIHGIDAENRPVSAPVVMFDRLTGEFAGGRWVFAAFTGAIDAKVIRFLAETASIGAFEYSIRPVHACLHAGEVPKFRIAVMRPQTSRIPLESYSPSLKLIKADGTDLVVKAEGQWGGFETNSSEFTLENYIKDYVPGHYSAEVSVPIRRINGPTIFTITAKTGFWVFDEKLMRSGAKITADRHFLYRNEEPFPVAGTTYMASDVARRFLLEPNTAVWDKDFSEMKRAGVNMIRTGIWTAWKLYLDQKGEVKDDVLRAFEAFLLTAKKYDIPIIFTFFAFLPEMFGGKNAYLDPQAIAGQKRFVQSFADRAKLSPDTIWDLINEPSFNNPKNLWSCRPNYDEFEKTAWKNWLLKHFDEKDESKLSEILQEKWRLTSDENPFELPRMEDFENVNIQTGRRPLKTLEYRLFAQDIFENWAAAMRAALREAGNSGQFVTVGQDEAGTGDSPNPQFHADSLDFTCLHNWWANDDLLWDGVMTKSPGKPNLVEETGVMSYENPDGSAWRSEKNVGQLLEQKMALSLGANSCGFIEWIWNTNPYMNIDNEAGIGFLRVDQTEKPELYNFRRIAQFANENRRYFRGKVDEKTLLVIPHSHQFAARNFAGEATKKAARVFHYQCRHTLRAVSEYNLETILAEPAAPALIICPSPNCLSQNAWENILKLVEKGSTLAITGYFADDEHLIAQPRLKDLGSQSTYPPVPVLQNERVEIDGKRYYTHFGGEKLQQVRRAEFRSNSGLDLYHRNNLAIWQMVPLELGDNLEAIRAFYDYALKKAKLLPYFKLENDHPGVFVRPTEFQDAILYLVINESSNAEIVRLTHLSTDSRFEIVLEAGQTNLFFINKKTGAKIAGL